MLDISCFGTNYIGIRFGCDTTAPTSGLYINDLPGLSLKLAANLADGEAKTGETLIRNLEGQAIREVWQDIKSKISQNLQVNQVIDQRQVGLHRTDQTIRYLALQGPGVGIKVEKSDCDPYTNIRINYVTIKANSTVLGKTLNIDDGCTSTNYTFDITAGCGVKIYTNYTSLNGPILITVDATDLELEDIYLSGGCSCLTGCRCAEYGCFNVIGWDGTNEVASANGMTVNVSCVCDNAAILCAIQNELCMAVQLKLGILLLEEQLSSKRCNFFVQNSKEDAANQLIMWMGGVIREDGIEVKSKYWRLIAQTAAGIQDSLKGSGSKCVSCSGITSMETLP